MVSLTTALAPINIIESLTLYPSTTWVQMEASVNYIDTIKQQRESSDSSNNENGTTDDDNASALTLLDWNF